MLLRSPNSVSELIHISSLYNPALLLKQLELTLITCDLLIRRASSSPFVSNGEATSCPNISFCDVFVTLSFPAYYVYTTLE